MHLIYDSEAKLEQHFHQSAEKMIEKMKEIGRLKTELDELENPKDESLDNKIVVWASTAFGNREWDADQSESITAIHSTAMYKNQNVHL